MKTHVSHKIEDQGSNLKIAVDCAGPSTIRVRYCLLYHLQQPKTCWQYGSGRWLQVVG
jgi:hypothetical protein